jgi:hypothetical protein
MPRDGRTELVETLRLRFADEAKRSAARPWGLASMLASSPFSVTTLTPVAAASHPTILAPSAPLPVEAPSSRRSPLRLFATFAVALVVAALATAGMAALLPRRDHAPAAGKSAPQAGARAPAVPAAPTPPASLDAPPTSLDAHPTTAAEPPPGPAAPSAPLQSTAPATPATGRPARRPAKKPAATGFVDVNFGSAPKGTPGTEP